MATNNVFNSIVTGINEAIKYEKGNLNKRVKVRKVIIEKIPNYQKTQIKEIRNKLKLTQAVFAKVLGVSIKTVEAWESGRNIPNGSAQRILDLLKKDNSFLEKNKILQLS